MRIRTSADLGAVIRDRRTALGLDQKTLAKKVGVSRQWIVDAEKGKPGISVGLVLRTAEVLGILLDAGEKHAGKRKDKNVSHGANAYIDIDSIIANARKK